MGREEQHAHDKNTARTRGIISLPAVQSDSGIELLDQQRQRM